MKVRSVIALAVLSVLVVSSGLTAPSPTVQAEKRFAAYLFIEVETVVYPKGKEDDDDYPQERRWYISNVIEQPQDVRDYSLKKQKFIPYFSKNVMDPAEARGIMIDYGEQDLKINGESSIGSYATKAEAEAARTKEIEYRKNQSGNIYTFEIDFRSQKGEETSKPKLLYRDKGTKAHYEKGTK
jgi:hypothetical protein